MNNKLKAVAALAICGMIAVGGTIAYMSNTTNTASNVFTIGSGISGEVTEPSWKGDVVFTPGQSIAKNPMITNTSEGDDAYVGLKVKYSIAKDALDIYNKNNKDNPAASLDEVYQKVGATDAESYIKAITTIELNKDNKNGTWVNIPETNNYYYAALNTNTAVALAPNAVSDPLFTNVVINNMVNNVEMNIDTMLPFEINVTGYLVQSVNVNDPVTELTNLMK